MILIDRPAIARRLRAVFAEIGTTPTQFARENGMERTRVSNWLTINPAKPSRPDEEAMARLCQLLPGLTLDYIYLGRLSSMPTWLAIRLTARELGLEPAQGTETRPEVLAALGRAVP